ncbi:MAG: serine protein kinase PrkA [Candidatus Kapabacteria bacterium]|nr:serine protein kinase PrkA [Ignavibacteriota bacterium]MCW5886430.1 serine protein kinase PrkA [Candidatus Kapabacteria bacterium]
METFLEIQSKAKRLEVLINLGNNIREKERRTPVPFNDFLYLAAIKPRLVFRDIFQLFHDMVHHYVPEGQDEFKRDSEHAGFYKYDTAELLQRNCDDPFFADRLFANRFMNMTKDFRKGTQNNRIYIFEGPPGSGKSTFLNNLLYKFEEYTKIPEGISYKTYWRIDIEKLGGFQSREMQKYKLAEEEQKKHKDAAHPSVLNFPDKHLEFSCPNHDHPILQIPKYYRKNFLDELITDEEFKQQLFNDKEYEWVLKDNPCAICSSIQKTLHDRLGDPLEVFSMINARSNYFNRQLGEGVSVFNPGDPTTDRPISKPALQYMINDLLRNDEINYAFSYLAKTNNGILALMDIKESNIDRLKAYHGIISDGVHKVELTEEYIRTFFIGLVNPEDKIHYEKVKSFQDRIISVKIPYVLDYNTEVAIYKNKFSEKIIDAFLPGVLENFAKIIIVSRLENESPALRKWINKPEKYSKYLDKNLLLLKMEVFIGTIPDWISEEDIKRFDKVTRKEILASTENEGQKGISGRKSLSVFNDFYSKCLLNNRIITMDDVREYFTNKKDELQADIPQDLIDKLVDLYDYEVVQKVKESVYYYNESHISNDIQNYLFAVNFEVGDTKRSPATGEVIKIDEEFLQNFEMRMLGATSTPLARKEFRKDTQSEYVSFTLTQEINVQGKNIIETKLYKNLFERYTRNLKENALAPYLDNTNFRRAILDYDTQAFNTYDERLKRDVIMLINNLINKFSYKTAHAAQQVCIYVLDKGIAKKY